VADSFNHRIQKFNSSGVFQLKWGSNGSGDGQFSDPRGVAVDASGSIFVVDTYNHRIQRFNSSGVFQEKWGSNGSGDGQCACPQGMAIDGSGTIYVAERDNHRVQKFTRTAGGTVTFTNVLGGAVSAVVQADNWHTTSLQGTVTLSPGKYGIKVTTTGGDSTETIYFRKGSGSITVPID
jgi:hypothetical protein